MIFSPSRMSRFKFLILLLDLAVLLGAFAAIFLYRVDEPLAELFFTLPIWILALFVLSNLYIFGTYDVANEEHWAWQLGRSLFAVFSAFAMVTVLLFIFRLEIRGVVGRGVLAGALGTFFVISGSYKIALNRYFLSLKGKSRWLVLAFDLKGALKTHLVKDFQSGVLGPQVEVLDNAAEVEEKLKQSWSGIIVGVEEGLSQELSRTLMKLKLQGQYVADVIQVYEKYWRKIPVFYIGDRWLLFSEGFSLTHNRMGLRFKRLFDIIAAVGISILASPLMLFAYVAIKLDSPGPVIFSQTRTGKDDQTFTIFKFRSMRLDAEKDGAQWAKKNDDRVTRLGKFLRKTRIDELPQLYNVFVGDMSFIGPRPERPEFNEQLEKQIPYYSMRHLVRPGLSGWAQVNYPYGASVEDATEKLQYELFYIKNYSIWLDLKIALKTIQVVLFGKGR